MFETDWAIDIQMPFRCLGANEPYLVGGLEHFFYFSTYWESSSQLTHIFFFFQRGGYTTNQIIINYH